MERRLQRQPLGGRGGIGRAVTTATVAMVTSSTRFISSVIHAVAAAAVTMSEWIVKVVPAMLDGSLEDWSDLEVLDPDHPLLAAYQEDLARFLQEEDRQLTLKIIHQVP